MHKFGDVVLYQMGVPEKTVNALVVQSNPQPDGEHLVAVFLDPAVASSSMSGMLVDKAVARAFPVPLKEGVAYGWKDLPDAEAMAPDTVHLDPLRYESLLASEKLTEALTVGHDTQTAELLKVAGELSKANDAFAELNTQVSQLTSDNSGLRAIVEKLRAENASLIEAHVPAPVFETKHYADGSSATGVAPLPDKSPDEQKAEEAS